jgi:hypothetical protein
LFSFNFIPATSFLELIRIPRYVHEDLTARYDYRIARSDIRVNQGGSGNWVTRSFVGSCSHG